jgi:hypothetical protein
MTKKTIFSFIILAGVVLAACQGPLPATTVEPDGQAQATAASTPEPSWPGASALVLEEQPDGDSFAIVAVAADTGQALAGVQAVMLGSQIAYGFSNDRSELAYVSYQPEVCTTYCLGVLNLRTWKTLAAPIPIDASLAWFISPAFDENSGLIAVIVNKQTDTISEVLLADRSQGRVVAKTNLPANIFKAARLPDGRLALYGLHSGQSGTQPQVYVALLNEADLSLIWEKTLPEVPHFLGDINENGEHSQYLEPAAVFSSDGSQLYLVAADKPLLVTVNFQNQTIQQATIQAKTSWLERLLAGTAGVVYAKSMNGTSLEGALSADGRSLYVVGQEVREIEQAQGGPKEEKTALGLRVIDVRSGELLREVATEANHLALSPDGQALLLQGWQDEADGSVTAWTDVLDLATMQVAQRLKGMARPARLLDGSPAWLLTDMTPEDRNQIALYRPGEFSPRSVVSRSGYVDWLIDP